jgi:hypothetical protein
MKLERNREIKDKMEWNQKIRHWIELWQILNKKNPNLYELVKMESFKVLCFFFFSFLADRWGTFRCWIWRLRPLQSLQPPPFDRETPPLQPHVFNIKCLHPIFFMDLHNILSIVSQVHNFRHHAVWVGTFKSLNVEL